MYFGFNLSLDQYFAILIIFNPFAYIVYIQDGQTYYVKLIFKLDHHHDKPARQNQHNFINNGRIIIL